MASHMDINPFAKLGVVYVFWKKKFELTNCQCHKWCFRNVVYSLTFFFQSSIQTLHKDLMKEEKLKTAGGNNL